jgi:hypothetical protein
MSAIESEQISRIICTNSMLIAETRIRKTTLVTTDTGMLLRSFLSFILDPHTTIVGLLSLETPFTL